AAAMASPPLLASRQAVVRPTRSPMSAAVIIAMSSSVSQLDRVAIAVSAQRAAAVLDDDAVGVVRRPLHAQHGVAGLAAQDVCLLRGEEDGQERLAGSRRPDPVARGEGVVQALIGEVDLFETTEPSCRQV